MAESRPSLEKSLKEISEQLFKMNQIINRKDKESVELKEIENETLLSPKLKRKAEKELKGSDEESLTCEIFFIIFLVIKRLLIIVKFILRHSKRFY